MRPVDFAGAVTFGQNIPFAHVDLDSQHGLSAFGLVLQLTRLNCLMPQDLLSALGLRMRYGDDWSYRLAVSSASQSAIHTRTHVNDVLRAGWAINPWQPFSGSGLSDSTPWDLRACSECLRYGYHSNLFQMPWIEKCSWHGVQLSTQCPDCGRLLGRNIQRDRPILLCDCGSEPIDQDRLLEYHHPFELDRNQYIDRYLKWANTRRQSAILIGSVYTDHQSTTALKWLVQLPRRLTAGGVADQIDANSHLHTQNIIVDSKHQQSNPTPQDLLSAPFATLCDQTPTMVELPLSCANPMKNAGRSLALRCPVGSLSPGERKKFGLVPEQSTVAKASRTELMLLPAFVVTDRLFFDARVLSRDVYGALADLCRSYLARRYPNDTFARLTEQLYERIFAAVLTRGYADSAAACVRKHVPEHVSASQRSPRQWRPVILVHSSSHKSRGRIVWIRSPTALEDDK